MTKIFRSATGEQAPRWLTLKCEPHSATLRVTEGGSNPLVPEPKKQKNNRAFWARLSFYLAQAEGFEPPCRLGKRFSRPPRCDHFDKPAYEILLNTWAFEVARRRRIQFATFGGRRNKPAYFLKFVFRILDRGEYLRQSRNIPAYFLKFVLRILALV